MAILKHFSMRTGNYSGAIDYLLYEHNEFTQELVVDEYDTPVMREGILFDGINCNPWSYDYECSDLNKEYNKNQNYNDIKQHHYIISFDPKDTTDCGLTADRAQALGLEYAKRNFPGHQTLVCTHPDGHNHTGNIHVHIVFNSLRKNDVDERAFMERPCDHKAGFKHHETKQRMVLLKTDLMEMCQRENLHQVDLISPSKERITDREYYAAKRLEEKSEKDNNPSSSEPTKLETQKNYLRHAIRDCSSRAKNDSEFAALLLKDYKVTLKTSRGRYSYLHPDRTKPIRGRMLGSDYEETHLREVFKENSINRNYYDNQDEQNAKDSQTEQSQHPSFSENHDTSTVHPDSLQKPQQHSPQRVNKPECLVGHWKDEYGFIHHTRISMPKELARPSDIPFINKMQTAVISSINEGYIYRSKDDLLKDLRQLSQSVSYAQERGFTSVSDIEVAYQKQLASLRQSYSMLSKADEQIDLTNERIHFVGLYRSTQNVYNQYRNQPTRNKSAFREKYYAAISDHERAYRFLTSHGHPDRLPSVKKLLKQRNEQLIPARNKYNDNYMNARCKLNEIERLRKTIYPLFSYDRDNTITKNQSIEHSR